MRPTWEELPEPVRRGLEAVLGFEVVRAESQRGGFSPGVAARVHAADGREAFVKAASAETNEDAPEMHRLEARWTSLLPPGHPSPRLLGSYEEGPWVALALEAVDGQPPDLSDEEDLAAVVAVLQAQSAVPADPALPTVLETLGEDMTGWRRLAVEQRSLTPWDERHLRALSALEPSWERAAGGDAWLHLDARADNVLVRRDGTAVLVDWPWSCRGAALFDAVGFVPSAVRDGALGVVPDQDVQSVPWEALGEAAEELLHRVVPQPPADDVTALVCAFAGYMQHRTRQPPPPGMATVRAAQAAQGRVACAWLARRTGWR